MGAGGPAMARKRIPGGRRSASIGSFPTLFPDLFGGGSEVSPRPFSTFNQSAGLSANIHPHSPPHLIKGG